MGGRRSFWREGRAVCGREGWFDALRRWRPSEGSVRGGAERGSACGEPVQRRVAGACWWDLETASMRRAGVCPFTGAACARLLRRWRYCLCVCWWLADVGCHAARGSSRHVPPPRFCAVLCVRLFMCEAAYADSILLLLLSAPRRPDGVDNRPRAIDGYRQREACATANVVHRLPRRKRCRRERRLAHRHVPVRRVDLRWRLLQFGRISRGFAPMRGVRVNQVRFIPS